MTPDRLAVLSLSLLLFLLPFEPRRPAVPLLGLEFTLLEILAALVMLSLLRAGRGRAVSLLLRPPVPLAFLAAFAAANLLSAALAPSHRALAFVFSLRMVAAAAFAFLVAASPGEAPRPALVAVAGGACVVAVLVILEGTGGRFIDPFLDLFRVQPFWVGEARRASGAAENPNLAGAFLLYGLVATAGIGGGRGGSLRAVVPLAGLLSAGVLFTYSRGGLVGSVLALVTLAVALAYRDRSRALAPAAALAVLLATMAVFAWRAPVLGERWSVEAAAAGYGARYEPRESFLRLSPGEERTTGVRLTNTGRRAWDGEPPLSLVHMWYDVDGRRPLEARAQALGAPVLPGRSLAVEAAIRAPDRPGLYALIWDIAGHPAGNFSSLGVEPAVVPVAVGREEQAPFEPGLPQGQWRRGRLELWRLALAMWRAHPVTGVGPDNFRWLHGAYGGWIAWSVLTHADSLFLETAATTGVVGLLTLLGALASTAVAAWRRLRSAPPGSAEAALAAVLLALTAGIAAHGLVHYSLGFTGHYLALGFVVGAASAPGPQPSR